MKFTEGQTIELKREYTDDIKKSVVAFANTNDGAIYLGIEDSGNIVGVSDGDGTMLKVSNTIRDSIKPDVTMFVSYERQELAGKIVIKVLIQKGASSPYYIAGKGIRPEGVYVRQGASSVPASETLILRMIKETDGEKYEEMRSLIQELTFAEAEKEFKLRKIPLGLSQQKSLKLTHGDGIYSNLGLLLSDQCKHTIKAAVFAGIDKTTFKDRREFGGSLLKQLNDVYEYIDLHNLTRSEFTGLHRNDKRDYPLEAIREALLNTLVHRDYSFSGSTLISIFNDRLEFVSIGGLVKGISYSDIMLGVSITRNENLANIFYRLTLVEAYGIGMQKILRSYADHPSKPIVEVSDNAFKITLPNTNAEVPESARQQEFSKREQEILDLFKDKGVVVRREVELEMSISQQMAVRLLKQLVDKKAIKVQGAGKNTSYILA